VVVSAGWVAAAYLEQAAVLVSAGWMAAALVAWPAAAAALAAVSLAGGVCGSGGGAGGALASTREVATAAMAKVNPKAASAKKIAVSRATQDAVGIAPVKKDTNAVRR